MAYAKFFAMVVTTIASAGIAVLTDGIITDVEWVNVASAGIGSLLVFTAPNIPYAPITKFIVSALMAVLTLLTSLITDGITPAEWLQLLVAAAGAIGVYVIPNSEVPSVNRADGV